jgi:RNA polymerase sigma factor (sigma-70 family)
MTAYGGLEDDENIASLAILATRIALNHVPRQEASDVAQTAIAVYLHKREQEDIANPQAYITRVTFYVILELWRELGRYVPSSELADLPERAEADAFEQVLDGILAQVVVEQVNFHLTERQRQILKLHCQEGISRQQVADLLDLRPETIKATVRASRQKLLRKVDPIHLRELGNG